MNTENQITAIIELLENVRQRKGMYLNPVDGRAAENFVNGIGCSLAVLDVRGVGRFRDEAAGKRGWRLLATKSVPQMQESGLSDEQIADEILAIEAEEWRLWQTR